MLLDPPPSLQADENTDVKRSQIVDTKQDNTNSLFLSLKC